LLVNVTQEPSLLIGLVRAAEALVDELIEISKRNGQERQLLGACPFVA
jgi:hypothetical protein